MPTKTRISRLATALAIFLVAAVSATLVTAIWFARGQATDEWRAQLDNLSLVLAEQAAQEVTSARLVLDSIAESVQDSGATTPAELRARMGTSGQFDSMRDKTAGLPQVDVATIVDASGDVVNLTRGYPAPRISLADRDYFQAHLNNPRLGLHISAPVRNRSNGQWTFYLSRRLSGPNGEFLGLVLVGFSSNFLSEYYQKINLGDDASVTLYRRDFTLLARWPHQDNLMGKVNRSGSSYHIIEQRHLPHGVVEIDTPRFSQANAGVARLGAARVIRDFPLIINVTVTDKLYLAQWRRFSLVLLLVGGLSALGIAGALAALIKLLRGRERDMEQTRRLQAKAEAASMAKSDFLAMMSHEIRTPLTAIIGFAEILERTQPGQAGGEAGTVIARNGHHLLAIINDILDISKIEAGRLHLEQVPFAPADLAAGVHAMLAAQAAAKGIGFTLEVAYPLPALVLGDPTRFRQVLFNLAGNGIKFTEHGSVTVALGYDAQAARLQVQVRDTGIGMSEAQLAGLFQPFAQADSSVTRKYGGTGLGLHLVKQLATRMGGSVQVRSTVGVGSAFALDIAAPLPDGAPWLDSAATPAAGSDVAPVSAAARLTGRVLLAEDGADNQVLIASFLQGLGLEYTVVGDGAQAVQAALAGNFDLVLMDIQMPVMDGVRATETLRAAGYGRPIVALTANVMADDLQRYAAAGCNGSVAKPIRAVALIEVLAGHLQQAAPDAAAGFAALDGYRAIHAAFHGSLPARLQEMDARIGQERWLDVAALAHRLRGTAGAFGFPDVTYQAGQVEAAATHHDGQGARRAFDQLIALPELAGAHTAGDAP